MSCKHSCIVFGLTLTFAIALLQSNQANAFFEKSADYKIKPVNAAPQQNLSRPTLADSVQAPQNPDWYRRAQNFFLNEGEKPAGAMPKTLATDAQPVVVRDVARPSPATPQIAAPLTASDYPNLSSVPLQPPADVKSGGWAQELQADRNNAQQLMQQQWSANAAQNAPDHFQEFAQNPVATASPSSSASEDTQNWPKTPIYVMQSGQAENLAERPADLPSTNSDMPWLKQKPIEAWNQPMPTLSYQAPAQPSKITPLNAMPANADGLWAARTPMGIELLPLQPPIDANAQSAFQQPLQPFMPPAMTPTSMMPPSMMPAQQPMMQQPQIMQPPSLPSMQKSSSLPSVLAMQPLVPPNDSAITYAPAISSDITSQAAQNNYASRMQQSAPYTGGTMPYYPYGYSGFGRPQPSIRPVQVASNGQVTLTRPSVTWTRPVATLYFRDDGTTLGAAENKVLEQVADWYRGQGGGLKVIGHSSSRTKDMDPEKQKLQNYRTSLDRAEKVASQLRKLGIPDQKLLVNARGDTDKAYAETMPNGDAWNRRVEIYWDLF